MGVIYKLNSAVTDFILEQKRTNPNISCRGLTAVISDKFNTKVSKSSINAIVKGAGLSMPVGRRTHKKKKQPQMASEAPQEPLNEPKPESVNVPLLAAIAEPLIVPIIKEEVKVEPLILKVERPTVTQSSGAILLKAADVLLNGSNPIAEAAKRRMASSVQDHLNMIESLIYLPLHKLSEDLASYLSELEQLAMLAPDMQRIILNIAQEVRCIKVNLRNGRSFFLDGSMHTIWPTQYTPFDFSATHYNAASYINRIFRKNNPLVLFMAPGKEVPDNEFFTIISNSSLSENRIERLILYGNKFEEIENVSADQIRGCPLVFGLWPWQFVNYRTVNKLGEFRPFRFEPLQKEFYCAETEISLSHHSGSHAVVLNGFALKTNLSERTRILILTNSNFPGEFNDNLINLYFKQWPNLEEGFQDFNQKIEKFTYFSDAKESFSLDRLGSDKEAGDNIKDLFYNYLQVLDLYVKMHFLPQGYNNETFGEIKERFYDLNFSMVIEDDYVRGVFNLPADYKFHKDLEYACRRVNEQDVFLQGNKKLWLRVG